MSEPRGRNWLSTLLRILESPATRLIAVTLLLVLVFRAVDSDAMRTAASTARWNLVWPALALVPVQVLWGAALWRSLARTVDPEVTLPDALRASMGSLSVSIWTPGRAGDFAARPSLMPRGSRRTLAVAVGAENILRLPVPLLLAAPAAFAVGFTAHPLFAAACVVIAGLAVGLLWAPALTHRVADLFGARRHTDFLGHLSSMRRVRLMAGHGLRYVLLVGQFTLVALAMSGDADAGLELLGAACMVILAAKLIAPLLNFAELGIREGASLVAFGAVGLSPEAALQASLLLYGINVLIPAALGAFFWLRRTRRTPLTSPAETATEAG